MRADRKTVKEAVQRFIDEPDGVLKLDVAWVKQASRDCPRHLTDEKSVFICGTNYVNEENADGDVIKIALATEFKDCVERYSVNFIYTENARWILCQKCLAWLRKQLHPLKSAIGAGISSPAASKTAVSLQEVR